VAGRDLQSIGRIAAQATAAAVFGLVFLLRFNDPGGSFAGLTDDHFFYLIRGWQILFGDLPVRDFVDHGAPLYYYVAAAVQTIGGRGTLSEIAFSSAALALSAALVYWLSGRASGWMALGLVGALFFVCLEPRYYNYPKFLSYAAAIPLLWRFADAPGARPRLWLAVVTVVAFLFRHDHGVFIAASMAALLLLMRGLSWGQRIRHFAIYAALVLAIVAPYLVFIQRNGGVVAYFQQAAAWAERDRDRAPVVWPGLFDNPDGVSDETADAAGLGRAVGVVRDNVVAFTYYTEIALPFFALFVLWASNEGGRPGWPQARAKIGMVAVLAAMLVAFFLRSPLEARLADPSVPLAILLTWLLVAVPRLLASDAALSPAARARPWLTRAAVAAGAVPIAFVLGAGQSSDFYDRLDRSSMVERVGKPFERAGQIAVQMRREWNLDTWASRPDTTELITLARYLNACTAPTDRVLIQGYLPQVLALARRAFAGGHADLRPGFFATDEAQRLTVSRLKAQPVPMLLLDTEQSYENFRSSFPLVTAYVDEHYRLAGTHVFDGRFGINLFVRKDLTPAGTWEPLGWPCYGTRAAGTSATPGD
jgi:hypothetical protein